MRNVTLLTQALFAKHGEALAPVALPHTWNAFDGQDGGADYWRGLGTMWQPFTAMAGNWAPTRAASLPSALICPPP